MTQATTTKTAGQLLAAELRKNFGIGTRTRRIRNGLNMRKELVEALTVNNRYPGYYGPARTAIFNTGLAAAHAWSKHFDCYRIDPLLHAKISAMSPWQIATLLGEMVDAGITNNGEAEIWFDAQARKLYAPVKAKPVKRECGICGWDVPRGVGSCRRTHLHWTATSLKTEDDARRAARTPIAA